VSRRDELIALAERVEALTGPDRMVAKLIFADVYPDGIPSPVVESGYGWREDDSGWWLATGEDARIPSKTVYPPNWLGSLDAAMSLAGDDFGSLMRGKFPDGSTGFVCVVKGCEATAKTAPNAVTAAALRALAEQEQ
jgi:hypothetical protein